MQLIATFLLCISCIVEELLVAAQREPHCLVNLGGEGHTAQDLMHSDRRKDLRYVTMLAVESHVI